jgi:hypothetical protein
MDGTSVAVDPDKVQAALDASCAALLALQDASDGLARGGEDLRSPEESERQAIELVHDAIHELRRLIGVQTGSPLALGFVRAEPDDKSEPADGQPRSLRIA